MNIRNFKELAIKFDDYKTNFSLFRIWVENCFDSYKKNMNKSFAYAKNKADFSDDKLFYESSEYKDLYFEWKYIKYDILVDLYNRMGWKIDDKISNADLCYDVWRHYLYYDIVFEDVYKNIQELEDDIDFTYAILILVENISRTNEIYTSFISKVLEGIKECNLIECIVLLKENRIEKVFIAMSFDESMVRARENITKAVKDSGYMPVLIDVKEHNNQIVPEIFKEIQESKFVIADLTGQRGGVYYEAGYAMAYNKPLILCCKKTIKETPHFDVAQINTIFWNEEKDLYNRLIKRIEATIGIER